MLNLLNEVMLSLWCGKGMMMINDDDYGVDDYWWRWSMMVNICAYNDNEYMYTKWWSLWWWCLVWTYACGGHIFMHSRVLVLGYFNIQVEIGQFGDGDEVWTICTWLFEPMWIYVVGDWWNGVNIVCSWWTPKGWICLNEVHSTWWFLWWWWFSCLYSWDDDYVYSK